MRLHLEILPHPAARWGEGASILVAARVAALLVQEYLRGKGTPGWSGIMLLRWQWLPPLLLPPGHPPPLPLMLPPPRPAGARWRSVNDRPFLPSRQAACISPCRLVRRVSKLLSMKANNPSRKLTIIRHERGRPNLLDDV